MNDININKESLYDVVVVGGGPAGLTAAIYLARAKYRVIVVEKENFGGQITITDEVVNYPGVAKTSGKQLTETMRSQAEYFGADFLISEVESLDLDGDIKTVHTARGDFHCFAVLLATGAHPRSVGFKGEQENKGRGVAYCATCDGEFFTGKDIFVIGGGYAAAEESVFLTKFARHVTILVREDDFTCAAAVADAAKNHKKITVLTNTEVEEVSGNGGLSYIRYKNNSTGELTEFRADDNDFFGVFVFVGYAPATELVKGKAELDKWGYIVTDREQKTTVDGLYAAGDVCIKPLRQVVTATGDGALAATELEKYAAHMQNKLGLYPTPPKTKEQAQTEKSGDETSVSGELFSYEMKSQLEELFGKMSGRLILELHLDGSAVSDELRSYVTALASITEKLTVITAESDKLKEHTPFVRILHDDGSATGLAFHGVPGGHEFTSFVLGLYNAAGPGQSLDGQAKKDIGNIKSKVDIKILVTLSCSLCPDLVLAAQRIAAESKNVTAEVYDINHFDKIKQKYNVMSVPCMVINDEHISFGKKSVRQIIDIIDSL